ncbi:MAG: hypothetical protein K8R23_16895 [Chthoniobacter sp.]|nr:hypothetical protein [Chthoniobacter sp.]
MNPHSPRLFPVDDLPALLAKGAGWLGVGCLALGIVLPWLPLPEFVPGGAPFAGAVRSFEPGLVLVFRAVCLLALLALAWGARVRNRQAVWLAAALLLAVLFFPVAVLRLAPAAAARAAWLWSQHDQLTGYTGDIYTAQEVRDATWQQRILVVNEPLETRILELPTWSPANLEWGRFLQITEWFGLSAWFAQTLGRGWGLALGGAVLLVLVRGRERALAEPGFFRRAVRPACAVGAAVLGLATLPSFIAAHHLAAARDLVRGGDPAAALAALECAARAVPAVREDGIFFLQVGRLESELGRATVAAEIFRAQRLAEDGFLQQAEDGLRAALPATPPNSVERRVVVRNLLVRAVDVLNTGQANRALVLLETVLAADPCNLKANYALQIACVRLGRPAELRLLAVRMRQTYRFLNTPTQRPVLAAAEENLASAEWQFGEPATALAHWQRSRRPTK